MLQNIVFQDNIYQLARSIENASEGLLLELCPQYFHKKLSQDIAFFDSCILQIHETLQKNTRLPDYLSLMKALRSCQEKYVNLLDMLLEGKAPMAEAFADEAEELLAARKRHAILEEESSESITNSEVPGDSRAIVSAGELSELLNFG